MKLSDRNSQQASDYAAKKREQLERANKLRKEREAHNISQQMASMDIADNDTGKLHPTTSISRLVPSSRPGSHSEIHGVSTTSITDPRTGASIAERIVIGNSAMGFHDPWQQPASSSRAVPDVAPSRRQAASNPPTSRLKAPVSDLQQQLASVVVSGEFMVVEPRSHHDMYNSSDVYFNPPVDPSGTLVNVSNMPIMCMSTNNR